MKIKVSEASGRVLDYMVAMCNGKGIEFDCPSDPWLTVDGIVDQPLHSYTPSTDWAQGGPIIDREMREHGFDLWRTRDMSLHAASYTRGVPDCYSYGPTALISAMRCLVASRLGEEVEVPAELFLEKHQ